MGTIALNGCGVFATYNALISLDDSRLFAEIYDYYTASASRVLLCGKMGIAPWAVGRYFEEQGYTVRMTDDYDEIDVLSSLADASILLYVYSSKNLGAHYVEYSKSPTGYIGRNTGIGNGATSFSSAVDYGYEGSRLYAIGIFIFKMEE